MQSGLWRTDFHTINGFNQFYRDYRPRNEHCLPVLALHGSLTQSGMWIALAEAAGTIRMLCPDQRGFGFSEDRAGDSCAEFASDALAFAQSLLAERYVVMGHSFACSIALDVASMAAEHVAALVLVDPVMSVAVPPIAVAVPPTAPPETFATFEEAARYFRDTEEGNWTNGTLGRFVQDIMIHDNENQSWRFPYALARLRRLRSFTASAASDYGVLAKAKLVRCPVLVFRGGLSKRFPPTTEQLFLRAFTSKPKIVVCPNSGHFPTTTETNIVVEELKHFLDGIR
jgi:pimeloyl-ACP methyl ester carboxylesterase